MVKSSVEEPSFSFYPRSRHATAGVLEFNQNKTVSDQVKNETKKNIRNRTPGKRILLLPLLTTDRAGTHTDISTVEWRPFWFVFFFSLHGGLIIRF